MKLYTFMPLVLTYLVILKNTELEQETSAIDTEFVFVDDLSSAPIDQRKKSLAPYPLPKSLTMSYAESFTRENTVPFSRNYTKISTIISPEYTSEKLLPLLDLRGYRFNNEEYGGAGGALVRFPLQSQETDYMLGINTFYYYEQASNGANQQLSVGLEFLSKRWELRGNAYVPVGKNTIFFDCLFDDYDGEYWAEYSGVQEVSKSFNAEFGYYLTNQENYLLYFSLLPYYIFGTKNFDTIQGFEAKLQTGYTDYFSLEINYRYDTSFGSSWQGEFSIQIPLYKLTKTRTNSYELSDYQLYQHAKLLEVMPIQQRCRWRTNY
ncbi:MAG: inverse autotransporter beta domain-containing protein [Chlamydiota bacterium]